MIDKFEKVWYVLLNWNIGLIFIKVLLAVMVGSVKGFYIFGEDLIVMDLDIGYVC